MDCLSERSIAPIVHECMINRSAIDRAQQVMIIAAFNELRLECIIIYIRAWHEARELISIQTPRRHLGGFACTAFGVSMMAEINAPYSSQSLTEVDRDESLYLFRNASSRIMKHFFISSKL